MTLARTLCRSAFILLTIHILAACYPVSAPDDGVQPVPAASHFAVIAPTVTPSPVPGATPTLAALDGPVTVALSPQLAERYAASILARLSQIQDVPARDGPQPLHLFDDPSDAGAIIEWAPVSVSPGTIAERFLAVVTPFATLRDDIPFDELRARWSGEDSAKIFVTQEANEIADALLGQDANAATIVARGELLDVLEENSGAVGIVPFDLLDPRFKVLSVDGVNVLDNRLSPAEYPLAARLGITGVGGSSLATLLDGVIQPRTNRNPEQLASLLMTGVTAMSRGTAAAMEREGYTFPAAVISETLAAADITHVSNEVPFLDDCVVNNTVDNLILCSHTDYWAALEAIGTDIVGLSGNHVNDFGRDGAGRSLQFYRDNEIPIYGSGLTVEEACEPLLWEHNGNTFAFFALLAFGPSTAWASDELPGACYYYDRKDEVLERVAQLADEVDIVAVELQYLEVYSPSPTNTQVREFRELRDAGADIVTGVQSHVPQALEPYGAADPGGEGVIVYGLGNLFFDQMWSWQTRTELMARHTIYQGRLLNTEILTAVLEDFAQPRWADEVERNEILTRVFSAAPFRPQP